MSPAEPGAPAHVPVRQAVALGILHGPAELLPISSSGHVGAIPWLLGWSYGRVDEAQRKSFEVALHAGTAAALALARRHELVLAFDDRVLGLIAAAAVPPALTGLVLETVIEERLSTPGTIATGLLGGSLVMGFADRAPQRRRLKQARMADALWLGVAQAAALVPGVSRQGATLAAARLRGFRRSDAHRLSELVGLAPILGAGILRAHRAPRDGNPAFMAGAGAAFVSTLAAERILRGWERDGALWPFALYRVGLAAAIAARLRRGSTAPPGPRPPA